AFVMCLFGYISYARFFLFAFPLAHPHLLFFPPRRSSDLCPRRETSLKLECSSTTWARHSRPCHPPITSSDTGGWHGRECRAHVRSEEHTSELQSRRELVCRLLLEKKT